MPTNQIKYYIEEEKKLKRWKYDCEIPRKCRGIYGYPKNHKCYKSAPTWERCE